jgi:hypothetical protein
MKTHLFCKKELIFFSNMKYFLRSFVNSWLGYIYFSDPFVIYDHQSRLYFVGIDTLSTAIDV